MQNCPEHGDSQGDPLLSSQKTRISSVINDINPGLLLQPAPVPTAPVATAPVIIATTLQPPNPS